MSVIMRQEVDPMVLEPQMPRKCPYNAGLLQYGTVMWSWFVTATKAQETKGNPLLKPQGRTFPKLVLITAGSWKPR